MNGNDFFGEALEAGKSVVKKANDQVAITAKTAVSQVTGSTGNASGTPPADAAGLAQQPDVQQAIGNAQDKSFGSTQDKQFIQDLYGVSNPPSSAPVSNGASAGKQAVNGAQPLEDQQKLAAARGKLQQHLETYYKPTFEKPKQEDERAADKVEREEVQEMQELQQKEAKKPKDLALDRAQKGAEVHRGASG